MTFFGNYSRTKIATHTVFVKHELKGLLKYIGVKTWTSLFPTDCGRYSHEIKLSVAAASHIPQFGDATPSPAGDAPSPTGDVDVSAEDAHL